MASKDLAHGSSSPSSPADSRGGKCTNFVLQEQILLLLLCQSLGTEAGIPDPENRSPTPSVVSLCPDPGFQKLDLIRTKTSHFHPGDQRYRQKQGGEKATGFLVSFLLGKSIASAFWTNSL